MGDLTQLMAKARDGDAAAAKHLFAAVYADLHRLAAAQLRVGDGGGMATTSLVHETYLKLARPEAMNMVDRGHFFAVAARAMRQITVDRLRQRLAVKRGAGAAEISLDRQMEAVEGAELADVLALDEALLRLEALDPRLVQLVELRFFAGMNLEQVGELLGLSERTLKRDWRRARAFLHSCLAGDG